MKEELDLRDQKLFLLDFKQTVMDTILGVNKELEVCFIDSMEQISGRQCNCDLAQLFSKMFNIFSLF